METSGTRFMAYNGGIWISANSTEPPRMYTRVGPAIQYAGLEAALAGKSPAAPQGGSAVPALVSNPTLSPSQTIAVGVVGGVLEGFVAEEIRQNMGKPAWLIHAGKAVSFSRELFDRSAVWAE